MENKVHLWPDNTTLIAGSSILSGLEENRLKKYKAKIRVFPGAVVDDFYDCLLPLLKKRPSYLILHVGSNDAPSKNAEEILNELQNLKCFIKNVLPTVKVYFSCPTLRKDNIKANITLRQLNEALKLLPDVIINDNVDDKCIGKKGLHLNARGTARLETNFISHMRNL